MLVENQFWDTDEANGPFTADADVRTAQVLIFSFPGSWRRCWRSPR